MSCLKTSKIMLTAAVFLGITASPSLAITFNAAADFSATNNPNGVWQYGWSSNLGSTFNLLTATENLCGLTDSWFNPNLFLGNPRVEHNGTGSTINCITRTFQPDELSLHPGVNGQYSIVRWVAPEAGTYSLASTFSGLDFVGTTTDVHVLHNGTSLLDNLVNGFGAPSARSFASALSVLAGDTIDFAVGFGNGNFYYDTTGLAATISKADTTSVPEPTSVLGLLVLGAFGAGSLLKRKPQSPDISLK